MVFFFFFFFFQAEDGIRDLYVTGVQTCALPISVLLAQLRFDLQRLDELMVVAKKVATGLHETGELVQWPPWARRRFKWADEMWTKVRDVREVVAMEVFNLEQMAREV